MHLYESIDMSARSRESPQIITISGLTCSGKTTLARKVEEYFKKHSPVVLCQDDYYKDIQYIPFHNHYRNMECMEAFEMEEFKADMFAISEVCEIYVPNYDVNSNKRINRNRNIAPSKVVIIEGLHTVQILHRLARPNVVSIFVDTSKETCLKRRIERDTKLFGISEERVREHFDSIVYPNYYPYIEMQKQIASEVIRCE